MAAFTVWFVFFAIKLQLDNQIRRPNFTILILLLPLMSKIKWLLSFLMFNAIMFHIISWTLSHIITDILEKYWNTLKIRSCNVHFHKQIVYLFSHRHSNILFLFCCLFKYFSIRSLSSMRIEFLPIIILIIVFFIDRYKNWTLYVKKYR